MTPIEVLEGIVAANLATDPHYYDAEPRTVTAARVHDYFLREEDYMGFTGPGFTGPGFTGRSYGSNTRLSYGSNTRYSA